LHLTRTDKGLCCPLWEAVPPADPPQDLMVKVTRNQGGKAAGFWFWLDHFVAISRQSSVYQLAVSNL
jgi:hypothetical protein